MVSNYVRPLDVASHNEIMIGENLNCISKKEGQFADRLRKSTNKLGQSGNYVDIILYVFVK